VGDDADARLNAFDDPGALGTVGGAGCVVLTWLLLATDVVPACGVNARVADVILGEPILAVVAPSKVGERKGCDRGDLLEKKPKGWVGAVEPVV
jgi:hypothetical protein